MVCPSLSKFLEDTQKKFKGENEEGENNWDIEKSFEIKRHRHFSPRPVQSRLGAA